MATPHEPCQMNWDCFPSEGSYQVSRYKIWLRHVVQALLEMANGCIVGASHEQTSESSVWQEHATTKAAVVRYVSVGLWDFRGFGFPVAQRATRSRLRRAACSRTRPRRGSASPRRRKTYAAPPTPRRSAKFRPFSTACRGP